MSRMQFSLQLKSNNVTSNLFSTVERETMSLFAVIFAGEMGLDDSRVIVKHLVKVKKKGAA